MMYTARRPDEESITYVCPFCGAECYMWQECRCKSDTPPAGDGRVSRYEDGRTDGLKRSATLWVEVIEHRHSPVIAPASANNKVFPVDDIVPHIQSVRLDIELKMEKARGEGE